jgi:hypothetical protein
VGGCTAAKALLLEHADLLSDVADRLNALLILYSLHQSNPPTTNPFLVVFDKVLKVRWLFQQRARACCVCVVWSPCDRWDVTQAPYYDQASQQSSQPFSLTPCEKAFVAQLVNGPDAKVWGVTSDGEGRGWGSAYVRLVFLLAWGTG